MVGRFVELKEQTMEQTGINAKVMNENKGAGAAPPQKTQSTILVVDDEKTLRDMLEYNLKREGYRVLGASEGTEALRLAFSEQPDLVILDIMLPGMNGFDVCRAIRKQLTVPILMLSAREEEIDKVLGLELGADDYLTKPFGLRELLARVHAMLRRAEMLQAQAAEANGAITPEDREALRVLVAGDLSISLASRTVTLGGKAVDTKPKEFDLLAFLAAHPMQVFSRETLLDRVWGYEFVGGTRTVDVHVRWLRQKLEEDPANPEIIQTVYGVGYKFGRPVSNRTIS
jgi:DNA-binding response OmpR family regulator